MSKAIMEKVAAYLRQHADEELSLTDLAEHFHYSPSHLSRTFKKKMGFSIKQYVEALKMEKGIQEIVEGRQNVTETSMEAGYDSLGSFSNTFKRHTGLSPKNTIRNQPRLMILWSNSWMRRELCYIRIPTVKVAIG